MIILPLFGCFSATTGRFLKTSHSEMQREYRALERTERGCFYKRTFSHGSISVTGRSAVFLLVLWMKSMFHIRKSQARGWPIAERGMVIAPPRRPPHSVDGVTSLWRNTGAKMYYGERAVFFRIVVALIGVFDSSTRLTCSGGHPQVVFLLGGFICGVSICVGGTILMLFWIFGTDGEAFRDCNWFRRHFLNWYSLFGVDFLEASRCVQNVFIVL